MDYAASVVGMVEKKAHIRIKSSGVVAGTPIISAIFERLSCRYLTFSPNKQAYSGKLKKGQSLKRINVPW